MRRKTHRRRVGLYARLVSRLHYPRNGAGIRAMQRELGRDPDFYVTNVTHRAGESG